ncbi:hypothetical protein [Pseudomonas sp. NFACC37-1]|nr:hypothetical protein [Pseudomonas sp. NFACC37-1]
MRMTTSTSYARGRFKLVLFTLADKDEYATVSERLAAFVEAQRNAPVRAE